MLIGTWITYKTTVIVMERQIAQMVIVEVLTVIFHLITLLVDKRDISLTGYNGVSPSVALSKPGSGF